MKILRKVRKEGSARNPLCIGCGRAPGEINEYLDNPENDPDPVRFMRENEGTFNPMNGHFCCTECYIKIGMPSSERGWKAP